jgi:hypothetical protein
LRADGIVETPRVLAIAALISPRASPMEMRSTLSETCIRPLIATNRDVQEPRFPAPFDDRGAVSDIARLLTLRRTLPTASHKRLLANPVPQLRCPILAPSMSSGPAA